MKALRTPDERFENLPGYSFAPHYAELGSGLRMHYVDEGPADAAPVLLLHGEPSWSYLYRKMVPPLAAAGHRVVAPDLIGFGRSDKPTERSDYTYQSHLAWLRELLFESLDLSAITLFCQDWGGLLGLRLVAEAGERFARVVVSNTGLPIGSKTRNEAFDAWQRYSQEVPVFPAGRIIQGATVQELPPEVVAAYDAPFPDESFKAGARQFPMLVPLQDEEPEALANLAAWHQLTAWEKPLLTAFGDSDPIFSGGERIFETKVPGAHGQAHRRLAGGGHFIQEDCGEELAQMVIDFAAGS
ncbi:MAG: haloalkane dehalogenase [Acidobacteriota bacterium]